MVVWKNIRRWSYVLMDCLLGRHNLGYKRVHKINQISGLTVCQSLSPPHCRRICCLHLSFNRDGGAVISYVCVSYHGIFFYRPPRHQVWWHKSICHHQYMYLYRSRIQGTVIGTNERWRRSSRRGLRARWMGWRTKRRLDCMEVEQENNDRLDGGLSSGIITVVNK